VVYNSTVSLAATENPIVNVGNCNVC